MLKSPAVTKGIMEERAIYTEMRQYYLPFIKSLSELILGHFGGTVFVPPLLPLLLLG
jgi:hypothetical protein